MYEPIILAFVLTCVHLLGEQLADSIERFHTEILSLSAGMLITFVFLELLPELTAGHQYIGDNVYFALLIGFITFHVAEKYLYQHVKNKKELLADLAHLHIAGFIIDHFIVGFTLVLFFSVGVSNGTLGYLLFIPFFLHTISSALSLKHIHEKFESGGMEKVVLALSTVIGAGVAVALELSKALLYASFGIAMGVLLYVVVRDLLPENRMGRPMYFMLGLALSLALIAISKFVV